MIPYTVRITSLALAIVTLAATPSLAQRRRDGGDRGGDRDRRGGSAERAEPRSRQAPSPRVAPSERPAPSERVAPRERVAPPERNAPAERVAPRSGRPSYVVPNRSYNYRNYRPNTYSYRSYGNPYRYSYVVPYGYRPYGYRSGWSLGLYFGRPYSYGYPGYAYAPSAGYGYYSIVPGTPYGAVRIVDAPRDAQVFVDGYYAGVEDDYDGVFQHLNLEAGEHRIEIEAQGWPPIGFDVRVVPGETITYHANPGRP